MSAPPPIVGKMIGRYRLIRQLGAGGMGVVYLAKDETLGREVALKFLHANAADDAKSRARMMREARLASSLNHPNICTVYDIGESDGQIYIAFEYIPGKPLSQELKTGGLPAETVVRYGVQIADALVCAHASRILHRDLKSSNIIVTPEKKIKVLDFGLAWRQASRFSKASQEDLVSTQTSWLGGTLQYAPPELLRGVPPQASNDIWSLGVVLYQMASGKLPFVRPTAAETVSAILRDPAAPLDASAHPVLAVVIDRCLQKEPAARFQSAAEVRAALETAGMTTDSHQSGLLQWTPAPKRPKMIWPTIAALAILLVGAAIVGWRFYRPRGNPPQVNSLAVLPLENLSGDPNQDYFADGITDMLITDLGEISALRVISRTSVMQYKDKPEPIPQIAKDLNVGAVVEGSVLRSGSHVQITARLIDAKSDAQIWSETYDGDLPNILQLQADIGRAIADGIRVRLTPQENARISSTHLVRPIAFDDYLKGREYWDQRSKAALDRSLQFFQQAIEADPSYALAYAGLADSYTTLGNNRFLAPKEAFTNATIAAERALTLDDSLAEAHASLAFAHWNYDYDWPLIEREYKRAIELNPGYATTYHWYSGFLSGMGRHDEAIAAIKKARELDPLSPRINANVGFILYFARRYDDAIQELNNLRAIDPNSGVADLYLGMAYLEKGDNAQAISAFEKAGKAPDTPGSAALDLAYAYARSGHAEEARQILASALEAGKHSYVPALWIARVYAALGEKDAAFSWLERAYTERSPQMEFIAVDPRLDSLRSDPRFNVLLRKMKLEKIPR
ncbi:MAG TPA: protein kinase [Terriglobales bacterium]|nr:protein kinase [Terriglobales bacterium]